MANWKYKINLNGVISQLSDRFDLTRFEEDCPQAVKDEIIAEIEKAPPLVAFVPKFKNAKSIAEVNRIIDNLIDEADRFEVWLGFP